MLNSNDKLKNEINEAIAWGMPDKESTGMSNAELIRLLSKAMRYIQQLESIVKQGGNK